MSTLLVLTTAVREQVLPALELLPHHVQVAPPELSALLTEDGSGAARDHAGARSGAKGRTEPDAILIDARDTGHGTPQGRDTSALQTARDLVRLLRTTGISAPVLLIVGEGGLVAVTAAWGIDDLLLDSAGPAEVDARLRLAIDRTAREPAGQGPTAQAPAVLRRGELTVDEDTYTARLGTRVLDLTFKEFELLRFLAEHPGRVFTREQLLREVWGYDYYGGSRTVDVHVRRLRAKLGSEHEALIGTVRNVGYRLVPPPRAFQTETTRAVP